MKTSSVQNGHIQSGFDALVERKCFSIYNHYKVWDEIIYPFPNFNGATVEVWELMNNFIPYFTAYVSTQCTELHNHNAAERITTERHQFVFRLSSFGSQK